MAGVIACRLRALRLACRRFLLAARAAAACDEREQLKPPKVVPASIRTGGESLIDTSEVARLPMRLTTAEVCDLARFRPTTLWRRIKAGTMPRPVDAGRQSIFDRDAVLKALGMLTEPAPQQDVKIDLARFAQIRERQKRDSAEARRRERVSLLRGAKA